MATTSPTATLQGILSTLGPQTIDLGGRLFQTVDTIVIAGSSTVPREIRNFEIELSSSSDIPVLEFSKTSTIPLKLSCVKIKKSAGTAGVGTGILNKRYNVLFEDVWIEDCGVGLHSDGANLCTYEALNIYDNGTGVKMTAGESETIVGNDNKFSACKIRYNDNYNLLMEDGASSNNRSPGNNNIFTACTFENDSGTSIRIENALYTVFNGCRFEAATGATRAVELVNVSTGFVTGTRFTDCLWATSLTNNGLVINSGIQRTKIMTCEFGATNLVVNNGTGTYARGNYNLADIG